MEILNLADKAQRQEYESFVQNHPNGSFTQSLRWCSVKNQWGHEAVVVRNEKNQIAASMLVLIKKVPFSHKTFLYSPRGPVCDLSNFRMIEELLDGVKVLAQKHHSYIFKFDPYVTEENTTFIQNIQGLGFTYQPEAKELDTIQTRSNYMLFINGRTSEELFQNFHSKWRYNIRLAERKGVVCRVCDKNNIDDFYELMETTGRRDHFLIRPKEYFVKMLDSLGEHCRLYLCYYQGRAISGAIAVQYAGKTCYVYGASANDMRNVMPNYLMQWNMIQWAADSKNAVYDFQGIPFYKDKSHPNYGVYRFKSGFNGQVVNFAGEFDYIFSPAAKKRIDFCKFLWDRFVHYKVKLCTCSLKSIFKIRRRNPLPSNPATNNPVPNTPAPSNPVPHKSVLRKPAAVKEPLHKY